ncbi:MAG: hemin uptake protein HemP [Sulfitobacter sp.]
MSFHSAKETISPKPNPWPTYAALDLTKGGDQAQIVLGDQTYTLRITRAGKLILTK